MTRLDDAQRQTFLASYPDWDIDGEQIRKTFTFRDFNESMGFVNRVAMASEVADHHPDIDIRWNRVTLILSTHSEGALTAKDSDLAGRFETF